MLRHKGHPTFFADEVNGSKELVLSNCGVGEDS